MVSLDIAGLAKARLRPAQTGPAGRRAQTGYMSAKWHARAPSMTACIRSFLLVENHCAWICVGVAWRGGLAQFGFCRRRSNVTLFRNVLDGAGQVRSAQEQHQA